MDPDIDAQDRVAYRVSEGRYLVTRRFVYPSGHTYTETTSRATFLGWPLFQMTLGRSPETGRRQVAKAWLAVGRMALGGLAVGQLGVGVIAVAQLGVGLLFSLAQIALSGHLAAGQIGVAATGSYAQVAVARNEAVGQVAVARYALGQVGVGRHVYDSGRRDPEVLDHFAPLLDHLSHWLEGGASPDAPARE